MIKTALREAQCGFLLVRIGHLIRQRYSSCDFMGIMGRQEVKSGDHLTLPPCYHTILFTVKMGKCCFYLLGWPALRSRQAACSLVKETLIQSLSDFSLGFLYRARRQGTRIARYLRRMSTTLCIKIHMKSDSAIESAFP